MKKIFLLAVLGAMALSCTPAKEVVFQTPKTTRVAEVYDDYVVVVTRTTVSREQFEAMKARTIENRVAVIK